MPQLLRFGIPTLDELFGMGSTDRTSLDEEPPDPVFGRDWGKDVAGFGIHLPSAATSSSITILGPDGTGKSVLGLHLASRYLADALADSSSEHLPHILYVSTDLSHEMALKIWSSDTFNLAQPNERQVPFYDAGTSKIYRGDQHDLCLDLVQRQPLSSTTPEHLSGLGTSSIKPLSEYLERRPARSVDGQTKSAEVCFVDLAYYTVGDDWGFINRVLASLDLPGDEERRHLMVIDSVEGFETLVGSLDAFGEPQLRRSRIAQVMRAAARRCHIVFIVEDRHESHTLPEQFVTDAVIRLRSVRVKDYMRRTIEVEKVRAQAHIRGEHPYVIRAGRGSSTGRTPNDDDPRVSNAYFHVCHSVHSLSRTIMESRGRGRERFVYSRLSKMYAAFGIRYLDEMLAGSPDKEPRRHIDDELFHLPAPPRRERQGGTSGPLRAIELLRHPETERRPSYDTRGLRVGLTTLLIGEPETQKSKLGRAFLARCFYDFAVRLKDLLGEFTTARARGESPILFESLARHCLEISPRPDRPIVKYPRNPSEFGEFVGALYDTNFDSVPDTQIPEEGPAVEPWLDAWWTFARSLEAKLRGVPDREDPDSGSDAAFEFYAFVARILEHDYCATGGVPILLTTYDVNVDELADDFVPRLVREIELEHESPSLRAAYEGALRSHIVKFTRCRRIEIHDLPAAFLMHIVRRTVEAAQRFLFKEMPPSREARQIRSWRIRLVIDDLGLLRNTYPEVREETLFLPFLFFYLGREGVTTLGIDTQPGRPDTTLTEPLESELRALVQHRLYTWRFSFFGESRVAIAAIPPMAHRPLTLIRELRWEPSLLTDETMLTVDPHLELYSGVEEGRPQPVPLEIRLYAETPAFENYIREDNASLGQIFTPAARDGNSGTNDVIVGVTPSEYDTFRDFCYLQRGTRLDHTLVFQVDEFWRLRTAAPRRTGTARSQFTYLGASTVRDGRPDPIVDPYLVFQPRESENKSDEPQVSGERKGDPFARHTFFEPLGYDLEDESVDRVPFMWDFGFLLCREDAWTGFHASGQMRVHSDDKQNDQAKQMIGLVRRVWNELPRPGNETSATRRPSWRDFFKACTHVAAAHSFKTGEPTPAFDLHGLTPQAFSCLVLEIWASEIFDSLRASGQDTRSLAESLSKRSWPSEPDATRASVDSPHRQHTRSSEGLVPWLTHYRRELFNTWLLLLDVVDFKGIADALNSPSHFADHLAPSAVASRHWYKTACAFTKDLDAAKLFVPVGLPGHFSIRGDWFLAVAAGSRSDRLADRALDLLSSRRANWRRLEEGLGLPTRDLGEGYLPTPLRHLKNPLFRDIPYPRVSHVQYSDLRKLGSADSDDAGFHWLWRSRLVGYSSHARIWQKWLAGMASWWHRLSVGFRNEDNWMDGLAKYDDLKKTGRDLTSEELNELYKAELAYERFNPFCEGLRGVLERATPRSSGASEHRIVTPQVRRPRA